mmetsp:Transcript_19991/g.50950  ORF Transcript_19991/g.50950 Transcript_19991/m.50950 type:complete len:200 (-) Transcript_19991:15-614(-)
MVAQLTKSRRRGSQWLRMAGSEGGGGQRTTSPARMGWSEPLIAPTCTIAHTASGPKSSRALLSPATGSGCTTSAQACLPPAPSSMAGPAQNPPSHPPPEVPGATRDCAAYRSCASAAVRPARASSAGEAHTMRSAPSTSISGRTSQNPRQESIARTIGDSDMANVLLLARATPLLRRHGRSAAAPPRLAEVSCKPGGHW